MQNIEKKTKEYISRLPYIKQAAANLSAEAERIESSLAALPEIERVALSLHFLERLCYVAMSFRIGYSERSCKRLVKQGLGHLALMLYGEDDTFTACMDRSSSLK